MEEGEGGGTIASMVRLSLIKPWLLTPHVCVFFSFLILGLWNQINNKAKKETINQWVVMSFVGCILLQSTKSNKVCQQSGEVLSTKSEEIVDFACCVVLCMHHPLETSL